MRAKKSLKTKEVFKNATSGTGGNDGAEGKVVGNISKEEFEVLKANAIAGQELAKELETLKATLLAKDAVITEHEAIKSKLGSESIDELLKAKSALADLLKAKAEKEMNDTLEVIKGFNLFEVEEEAVEVAKFLVDNQGDAAVLIIKGLERSKEVIKSLTDEEDGSDIENKVTSGQADVDKLGSLVTEIIKKKNKDR